MPKDLSPRISPRTPRRPPTQSGNPTAGEAEHRLSPRIQPRRSRGQVSAAVPAEQTTREIPVVKALPHPPDPEEKVEPQSAHTDAWMRWLIGGGVGAVFTAAMLAFSGPNAVNVGGLLALFTFGCMVWGVVFLYIVNHQLWKHFSFPSKIVKYDKKIASIESALRKKPDAEKRKKLMGDLHVAKYRLHEAEEAYGKWKKGFGWFLPVLGFALAIYGMVTLAIWVLPLAAIILALAIIAALVIQVIWLIRN